MRALDDTLTVGGRPNGLAERKDGPFPEEDHG